MPGAGRERLHPATRLTAVKPMPAASCCGLIRTGSQALSITAARPGACVRASSRLRGHRPRAVIWHARLGGLRCRARSARAAPAPPTPGLCQVGLSPASRSLWRVGLSRWAAPCPSATPSGSSAAGALHAPRAFFAPHAPRQCACCIAEILTATRLDAKGHGEGRCYARRRAFIRAAPAPSSVPTGGLQVRVPSVWHGRTGLGPLPGCRLDRSSRQSQSAARGPCPDPPRVLGGLG